MKTLGLVGGVGPESTIEYYRLLVSGYREQRDGNYPPIIINSVNLKMYLALINAGELGKFADELVIAVEKLASAGADFAAFASNTPHIVFDEVQRRSRIPLISIVEATREKVQSLGLKKVGLFGTRFTMQAKFYAETFSRAGIALVTPNDAEQDYIHDKYMNELLNNLFLPETRVRLLAIADELKSRHAIEALILGGTELPLLLRDEKHNGLPLLDTTRIHVQRLVAELIR
ncbi:MAG: aspartate racemase [Pyrinomonadaceae bacterium]|jgi:aspartate racemase|nr:aspartate racemase [Pyrinomonadaceae bacterium]